MKKNTITEGDIVEVSVVNAETYTDIVKGRVENVPQATGDSWVIRDIDFPRYLYYISQPCLIRRDDNEQEA
jgi:hypothetical protein